MRVKDIQERFDAVDDEYLEFHKVENKLSSRPDIHAFILLNSIAPKNRDIISAASHDVIYLDFDSELIECLSDKYILELRRCGVLYDEENNSLYMLA